MRTAIVVGAGIIGLSIAWQLAKAGLHVRLLDQRHVGGGASHAAAGMLAPYSEAHACHVELLRLGELSLQQYPLFLQELSHIAEPALFTESQGTLYVAIDRDDYAWLQAEYELRINLGISANWLTSQQTRAKESLLTAHTQAAVWMPDEKQINPSILMDSLLNAFKKAGGIISENEPVHRIINANKQFYAVETSKHTYQADLCVNTTGAWSTHLIGKNNIHPNKGQLIQMRMPQQLNLKHMIRTRRVYLAPKSDGSCRVGATDENCGFDETITAGAVYDLLEAAKEAIPASGEWRIQNLYAGLRPLTTDQLPQIGRTNIPALYQAVGHGRAGFLLAPYTAYTLKDIIFKDLYANPL